MDVLVIAPAHVDLPMAQAEAQTLVNMLGARVLIGEVTTQDILLELAEVPDVLWFASHGGHDGIWLSGGEVLAVGDLASMIRGSECKCVFINTCSSEEYAEQLFGMTQIPVICTVSEVPDISAYVTARGFARGIAAKMSLPVAFQRSKTKFFRMIPDMTFSWNTGSDAEIERLRLDHEQTKRNVREHAEMIEQARRERFDLQESYRQLTRLIAVLAIISFASLVLQAVQTAMQAGLTP